MVITSALHPGLCTTFLPLQESSEVSGRSFASGDRLLGQLGFNALVLEAWQPRNRGDTTLYDSCVYIERQRERERERERESEVMYTYVFQWQAWCV